MITKVIDEKFPRIVKILLCIFGGAAAVYRILLFVDDCIAKSEKKHVLALVSGILCLIPVLGIILGIIDIIALIPRNQFSNLLR